jgi:hypothetical protein
MSGLDKVGEEEEKDRSVHATNQIAVYGIC